MPGHIAAGRVAPPITRPAAGRRAFPLWNPHLRAGRAAEPGTSPPVRADVARREHHWIMDLGHLKAELDRLAGAIEHAGGRVTERDLNYVEVSAELFYERGGERYEVHLKRLPDSLPG